MDFTFILVTALSGTTAGILITWLVCRSRTAVLAERIQQLTTDAARLDTELQLSRDHASTAEAAQAQTERELAAARADAAARLEYERQRFAEQSERATAYRTEVESTKAALQLEFQATASRLLEEKTAKFTDHNRVQVEAILQPLRQQLSDFRARVDVVYKTESDDRTSLRAQIEQLRLLNSRITDEAHALTQALKGQSQARGAWGELVLERLLESSGLRRGEDYLTQETITGADGRRVRPDIILLLPDDRHLVIDSKVSLVAYEQGVNGADEATKATARKAHVTAVRRHITELSSKRYENAGELQSPDYVLMFVPLEPAFTAALDADPELYEWAFDQRVILVTAPSLLATLKTIATLWKQDRQAKNVQEIARRGGLLYDKFAGLYSDLENVSKHLERARDSHHEALSKLKTGRGNLLAQVEELKTLGAKAQKSLPLADSSATS